MVGLARRLPGADLIEEAMKDLEERLLLELHDRLESIERGRLFEHAEHRAETLSARDKFQMLWRQAHEQKDATARECLFLRIVDQLTPDEARLLALMSAGDAFAIIHVGLGAPVGGAQRRLCHNLSTLGPTAGLRRPEDTPHYLSHLRALGLVESGAEDKQLESHYQRIEGGLEIRGLQKRYERQRTQRLKLQRATLKLSALGREFWAHCQPGDDEAKDQEC